MTAADKRIEERFERIEATLERVGERLDAISISHQDLDAAQRNAQVRHDREVAEIRAIQKDGDLKLNALIESQSATFAAIDRLAKSIDRFIQGRGSNGQEG